MITGLLKSLLVVNKMKRWLHFRTSLTSHWEGWIMTETEESLSLISRQQFRLIRWNKNCDRINFTWIAWNFCPAIDYGHKLDQDQHNFVSILWTCSHNPIVRSLITTVLSRFYQEEPLLMEAFGPCLPNNRAGGEFIRLMIILMINVFPDQKSFGRETRRHLLLWLEYYEVIVLCNALINCVEKSR